LLLKERLMTLTVALTDTAVTLGPVQLVFGRDARKGAVPDLPEADPANQGW